MVYFSFKCLSELIDSKFAFQSLESFNGYADPSYIKTAIREEIESAWHTEDYGDYASAGTTVGTAYDTPFLYSLTIVPAIGYYMISHAEDVVDWVALRDWEEWCYNIRNNADYGLCLHQIYRRFTTENGQVVGWGYNNAADPSYEYDDTVPTYTIVDGHVAATWYKVRLHELVTGGAYTLDVKDIETVSPNAISRFPITPPVQASNVLHDRRAYIAMWAPVGSAPEVEVIKDD